MSRLLVDDVTKTDARALLNVTGSVVNAVSSVGVVDAVECQYEHWRSWGV